MNIFAVRAMRKRIASTTQQLLRELSDPGVAFQVLPTKSGHIVVSVSTMTGLPKARVVYHRAANQVSSDITELCKSVPMYLGEGA